MKLKYSVGVLSLVILGIIFFLSNRAEPWQELHVTATAYNSLPSQTTATDSNLAAWGDRLHPGMRALAVSRDLLDLGLGHGTRVRIEGLKGEWIVRDKMNKRWRKKVDIYMGVDVAAAREWGRRDVLVYWRPEKQ